MEQEILSSFLEKKVIDAKEEIKQKDDIKKLEKYIKRLEYTVTVGMGILVLPKFFIK